MKYLVVCLLISCALLISAERDFFDQGRKSNLFAPLSDAVRPVLFKGIRKFGHDKLAETLGLDWAVRSNLLLRLLHSDKIDKYPINLLVNVKKNEGIPGAFNYQLQDAIDFSTDMEKLFKLGIEFFEKIHKIKNFDQLEGEEKYLWLKYADIVGGDASSLSTEYGRHQATFDHGYYEVLQNISKVNLCNRKQSIQQTLVDYYGQILLTGAQLCMNNYFSSGIKLKSYGENKTDYLGAFEFTYFGEQIESYIFKFNRRVQKYLNEVSSEIWACDPKNHIEGVTYTKLDRPFKDYSKKEKDLKCDITYSKACYDLNEAADRYFNIRPAAADIGENKVITGVRLVKKDHVIHIQIQDGKLLANGTIDEDSVSWKPLEDGVIYHVYDIKSPKFKGIDLSETFVDKGTQKAVTGISFEKVEAQDGGEHLRLVTYVTPFDFTSGELILDDVENPSWQLQQPQKSKNELKYKNDKLPVDTVKENIPYPQNQAYITFNTIKSGRGAGETVPFIDAQPVETYPPTLMSGAGLYYKGNDESSGFLGLKLFTYNTVPFMDGYDKDFTKY